MKQIFLLIALVSAVSAMAADRLYINDFDIKVGESKTIEVQLDNSTPYCALQADINLPEGITIDLDGDEYIVDPTLRSSRHSISSNRLADGAIRIFVTSQQSRAFTGDSGAIVTIDITADSSFKRGDITLNNVILVTDDGTRVALDDCSVHVNGGGEAGVPGDVNGDGSVNAGDVSAVYNVMLGSTTDAPVVARADVNSDGAVNAGDVSAVYNIMLK